MPNTLVQSHMHGGEDALLRRILAGITHGVYVDIPNDTISDESITAMFDSAGWHGTTVPTDAEPGGLDAIADHIPEGHDVHFARLCITAQTAPPQTPTDWRGPRPWILVIQAPLAFSPEHGTTWDTALAGCGYTYVFTTGSSRFYLAREQAHLATKFDRPPHPILDEFTPYGAVLAHRSGQSDLAQARETWRQEQERLTTNLAHMELEVSKLTRDKARLEAQINPDTEKLDALHEAARQGPRPIWFPLVFSRSGKPHKPVRKLLFHNSGKPRGALRHWVLRKNGAPRTAFRMWLNHPQYRSLRAAVPLTAEMLAAPPPAGGSHRAEASSVYTKEIDSLLSKTWAKAQK